jgi:hypothetical protein
MDDEFTLCKRRAIKFFSSRIYTNASGEDFAKPTNVATELGASRSYYDP